MLNFLPAYLAIGAVAGVLAGLLGVGGGLVIVPALVFVFEHAGIAPQHVLHLALGTSLASILFTSLSSIRGHHAHGAVNWQIVRSIAPGILLGTFAGATVAGQISTTGLKWLFVAFAVLVSLQMLAGAKPPATRTLPGPAGMLGAGGFIGLISSFVGIGGGSLSVPFMSWCNVSIHQAIGTSAAIGFPIALAGALGYLVNGWAAAGLPPGASGFVYWPALAGIVLASMLTASVGAKLAHRLPVMRLKKLFAVLLLSIAGKMLWGLLP